MTAVELFLLGYASDLRGIGREVKTINLEKGTMVFSDPQRGCRTTLRAKSHRGKLVISERTEYI